MKSTITAHELKIGDCVMLAPRKWGPVKILTDPKKYETQIYITYQRCETGARGNAYIAPDMEIERA
ncbi:hypothetical protein [Nocardia sp. CA-120079]|uniref:hypothetical protein n=1 Tax=Nocardia sp. CA-120079 TaxID=3239974 RepID=UPI003D97295F